MEDELCNTTKIDVEGTKRRTLELAVKVAMTKDATVIGFKKSKKLGLIFYRYGDNCDKFPVEMTRDEVIDMCWRWFEGQKKSSYSGDGTMVKGFRVYNALAEGDLGYDGNLFAISRIDVYYGK